MLHCYCLEILNNFCASSLIFLFVWFVLHCDPLIMCPVLLLIFPFCLKPCRWCELMFWRNGLRADDKGILNPLFMGNYFTSFRNILPPCSYTDTLHHSLCITVYICPQLYIGSASDWVSQRTIITNRVTDRCAYRIFVRHWFRI